MTYHILLKRMCNCGLHHQLPPIILSVKNKAPLVLPSNWNSIEIVETRTTNVTELIYRSQVNFNKSVDELSHKC